MDASASPAVGADINGVIGFFLKIENSTFDNPVKHKNTVIKYTKLPDYDFDSRLSWPDKHLDVQPRQRHIITLDDPKMISTRSLKQSLISPVITTKSNIAKRKIVTIAEDEENDLHPRFSRDRTRENTPKSTSKATDTNIKVEKQISQRTTSQLPNSLKYSKETKLSAKSNNAFNRKDTNAPKVSYKSKYSNMNQSITDAPKNKNYREKDLNRYSKNSNVLKNSASKNVTKPSESENAISIIKSKLLEKTSTNTTPSKRSLERQQLNKSRNQSSKDILFKEIKNKNKPVSVIYVPLDNYSKENEKNDLPQDMFEESIIEVNNKVNIGTEIEKTFTSKDMNVGTDPLPQMEDKIMQICGNGLEKASACIDCDLQTDIIKATFDSLDIPNVTLTKERSESKDEIVKFHSKSLPNLENHFRKTTSQEFEQAEDSSRVLKSSSYIIGHATVTCTTRKKINFHVVGSNNEKSSNQSLSPLTYPINVVSIFENEMKKNHLNDNSYEQEDKSNIAITNCLNELQSLNCSYVFNSNKLVKPSDIISTIRGSNGLLQSDYICEQFQRELNFIDSFFESLQYLESCSLSDTCFPENKVKSLIKNTDLDLVKHTEYGNFLSNLENGTNEDDTETMASKSLCLLNLLIRDEQRRAKNLLFVLKMREDALKDFTKSQILWLENKKKQDNTDISTLKKKQRGALLKLQHECGEMQRMRKALLTQSEKRKVALMKTKKNIELKLKNNVDVDRIILGKKKLKRNVSDRNTAPLKCFDLSSSGCEDSSTSRPKPEILLLEKSGSASGNVTSAEKCIQTGDSVLGNLQVNQATDTAAENFVVVDGGYLNILFHNLSLPHIFSNGKQYEVNEEALKNILTSANKHSNESDVVEQFMQQVKTPDLESSTPSTARSLVEELDQYYKGLTEEDKCSDSFSGETKNVSCEANEPVTEQQLIQCVISQSTMTTDSTRSLSDNTGPFFLDKLCVCEKSETDPGKSDQGSMMTQTGPLPVPAGEAAVSSDSQADNSVWNGSKSRSDHSSIGSQVIYPSTTSLSSLASPVHYEAEELRRQQLAIEREIKALEQQQCQLLVVREIPDKPPPPYTPPAESRAPLLPRMYVADETTEEKILKYIRDPNTESCDPTDAFDTFVKDFCIETLEMQKLERSDKPWDSCNLLPQKPPEDTDKLIKKTSTNLLEILAGATPPSMSGVGSRRSDHIDDILFAEWRRCEPEWTSLHADEAIVKNQIFESIFQKILTETVDEYKRTVMCNP